MELTDDLAMELSLAAGDQHAKAAGRGVWSEDDVLAAKLVYDKLKPVQKMDETAIEVSDGPA